MEVCIGTIQRDRRHDRTNPVVVVTLRTSSDSSETSDGVVVVVSE